MEAINTCRQLANCAENAPRARLLDLANDLLTQAKTSNEAHHLTTLATLAKLASQPATRYELAQRARRLEHHLCRSLEHLHS